MRKTCFYGLTIVLLLSFFQFPAVAAKTGNGEPTNYILIFQTREYTAKIGDSIESFFAKILKPQDSIMILSPVRPYNYSPKTRKSQPLKKLISRTKDVLKKDSSLASAGYRNIQESMKIIVGQIAEHLGTAPGGGMGGGPGPGTEMKNLLTQYRQLVDNYRIQRRLNNKLFIQLSNLLKKQKGRKFITLIYQQDFRIIPDRDTMDVLRENSEWSFKASEAFYEESTKDFLNTDTVSSALKDAGIILNLVYVKMPRRRTVGLQYKEMSGDVYESVSKVAKSTGGAVIATSKPASALQKVSGMK